MSSSSSIRARSSSLGGESVSAGAKKSRRSKEPTDDSSTMTVVGDGGDEVEASGVGGLRARRQELLGIDIASGGSGVDEDEGDDGYG